MHPHCIESAFCFSFPSLVDCLEFVGGLLDGTEEEEVVESKGAARQPRLGKGG